MSERLFFIAFSFLVASVPLCHADIYKCPDKDVAFSYSNIPCSGGEIIVKQHEDVQSSINKEQEENAIKPSGSRYSGERLSINYADVEVKAALNIVSNFSGIPFIISNSVKGNMELRYKNIQWDDLLDKILRYNGLSYVVSDGKVYIGYPYELKK
jgi:hypothetical protein